MDTEKVENVNEVDVVDYQEKQAGFTSAEPDLTAEERKLEKRLLLKADILIVGITSLVFLVNQWVSTDYAPFSIVEERAGY